MADAQFDVTTIQGKRTLWVDSERVDACMEYVHAHGIESVGINPARRYELLDIEFLRRYPWITELEIVSPLRGSFDLEPIRSLRMLRSLTISDVVTFSLADLPELRVVRAYWHPKLGLAGANRLELLDLAKYNPKSKDLSELPNLPALRELKLVSCPLVSLRGVARYSALQIVRLSYMTKLATLGELERLPALEILDCRVCRKLLDPTEARRLKALRVLKFNECGEIPNLGWVRDLPKLEEFYFVNTNVADGDLTPLLGLRHVAFLPKRHYSHSPEELGALLSQSASR